MDLEERHVDKSDQKPKYQQHLRWEGQHLFSSGLSFCIIILPIFFKKPHTMFFINLVDKITDRKKDRK